MSLLSWIIGSSSLVLRSTASTMVRSSLPSAAGGHRRDDLARVRQAEADGERTVASQVDRLALQGHACVGLGRSIDDQLGVDLEVEVPSQRDQRRRCQVLQVALLIGRRSRSSNRSRRSIAVSG